LNSVILVVNTLILLLFFNINSVLLITSFILLFYYRKYLVILISIISLSTISIYLFDDFIITISFIMPIISIYLFTILVIKRYQTNLIPLILVTSIMLINFKIIYILARYIYSIFLSIF